MLAKNELFWAVTAKTTLNLDLNLNVDDMKQTYIYPILSV